MAHEMEIATMYGEDAQAIRKQCGLTQSDLGKLWNKSRVQIGRYEKARQQVAPQAASAYRGLAAELSPRNAT
jgi:transcriptional regulator with XRE-family HTH domain